ncbi:GH92 family glycosyl hydrolase [uncultured Phyllobacterium sp.]|uniref:GH92 family glycosyl hydrolase n=1 Tax=uncultured Phyllobacterium sp. TaxID=253813 RepID=UPI00258C1FBD|nr:GH92 family glycosyl hydrolase [uncultured Phyllobacterium sp.]
MIFRRVLIAGLVGSAMLAGCNNADDKAPATPDAQGTFAEDISPLNGGVDQATIKGLKDALDTLQANIVILQGDAVTSKETLAALKSTIELLQSRAGQTEASVAALTELGPRIDKLDAGLKSLTDNFRTLDGRTAAIQADMDTLKPLREQFTALKDDYGKAIKLKLEAAALAPLLADIDLLKTGKVDAGKLADLQVKLDGLKDAVDKAKLGASSAEDFSKRIAVLEEAIDFRIDAALTHYVNPLIGSGQSPASDVPGETESMLGGFVNPGANVPFGMVSWGPETDVISGVWSPRGYHYETTAIHGFPMINLSGVGCPTMAPFKVQPVSNASDGNATFSHDKETVHPGYYQVMFDNGIKTELTATTRTGLGQFTFPKDKGALLKFTSLNDVKVDVGARTISAKTSGGGFCGSPSYNIYFFAQFDQAFTADKSSSILTFTAKTGEATTIVMKAGVSYVSVANAKGNLGAESAGLSFDEARKHADSDWNKRLNSIQVTGGTDDQKKIFYTALYRSFFAPSVFSDVNGEYVSFDGKVTVEKVERDRVHYTTFSSWDSYRSLAPMQALLTPNEAADMAQSLINDAKQCGGVFPMWVEGTSNSNIMPGDGASIIVAQTHAFGAQNLDTAAARKIMLDMAKGVKTTCRGVTTLPHVTEYDKRGYLGPDEGQHKYENTPTSNTLEYASTDFAISRFIASLDKQTSQLVAGGGSDDATKLLARSNNWTNLFNPEWRKVNGQPYPQLQPRNADGTWSKYTPVDSKTNYREGNAEQYTYMAPHNIRGILHMLVKDKTTNPDLETDAIERLDTFTKYVNAATNSPYLWVGNEPGFATPFFYNWTSQPYKSQALVRRILGKNYTNFPSGLPGNDDEGATSGWYVWGALGLYPEILAVPGLTLTSPIFEKAVVWRGDRKLITITADKPASTYIQSVKVDGKSYDSTWLPIDPFAKQPVTLDFALGDKPSCWGSKPTTNIPPSFGPDGKDVPVLTPAAACSPPQ